MKPEEFDPSDFEPGRKHRVSLVVRPDSPELDLPVLLVRGRNAGKTLVVFAGVHGDEYEGVRAILDLYEELDPDAMSGDFLAVPVANPPAFWAATRTSPLDEKNMARVFPGTWPPVPQTQLRTYLATPSLRAQISFSIFTAQASSFSCPRWLAMMPMTRERVQPQ